MFSTETATESDAADAHSYLLNTSHDLLEDHLAAKESELDFALKDEHIDDVSFSAFDHGPLYDRYDESGPSSVQPGDNNDFSEPGGSHMSLKGDGDDARPALDGTVDQHHVSVDDDTTPGDAVVPSAADSAMHVDDSNGMSKMISDEFEMNHHTPLHQGTPEINVAIPASATGLDDEPKHHNTLSGRVQKNTKDTPRSSNMSIKQESPGLTTRPSGYPPIGKNLPAFRAKSSIPAHIPVLEFARQCILAAQSSRLNPFALHPGEYELLRDHITHPQVTVYLNIRNAILRLWTRNPLVAVTKAEAAGCARDARYFDMSQVAYKWLVRNGYINYGCIELQSTAGPISRAKARGGKRRTIVVAGAGMAGLGCARHLEGLIAQLGEQWTNNGERPPRVVVLEGRKRIGGRVYSHPLKNQSKSTLPPGLRNTVEMGAQIITGFEHGNPLNCIIRGQLALRYHTLKDDTIIYDTDGAVVDQEGDILVEKLYNDILERVSQFRNKAPPPQTVEGDRRLIQLGRDPSNDSGDLISSLEDAGASQTVPSLNSNKIKKTLSLGGWDQDIGNEFEGPHSHIIGGYQQLPRGLWQSPTKLDVRFNSPVKSIRQENARHVVECDNGDIIEADEVVVTIPLGVLKRGVISFSPPLPEWKTAPIQRLGFGLLNKVALVYDTPFWEPDRDIFGTLNEAELRDSMEQKDYESRRGRFWLFWNCIKTTGRPTLVALMAGNAAHDTEVTDDHVLVREVTERLSKMFAPAIVPLPTEYIVTRWKKDPFAGGSYSFMGPTAQPGDYDAMARPIGSLHFAGEATCGTHPATVHGAYLSGLRAASEVVDSMLGPIEVQHPLVAPKAKQGTPTLGAGAGTKRGREEMDSVESRNVRQARNEDLEVLITAAILEQVGERPHKPERTGNNPYLLYTRDHWHSVKAECDEQRRAATGDANAKASKDHIRTVLGAKWRNAPNEVQQPYLDEANKLKEASATAAAEYKEKAAVWEKGAARIRTEFMARNLAQGESFSGKTAIETGSTRRERRVVS
ncbi:High mobility group HMG1/HMG2 [Lasiodiplodia theobromae]|uniref:High mobility group HMG1/HMG2 n=1 Tax=Lasiodiplodia theobromae TaxID=45133 RepID=UPI0015C36477|nr:High mobility group HMG1/HMG2 [Lasiodiplodia theobromae]KAF4538375.1 High mobility group HMG1/HMG2 [Lasiodiplodia theobromae]